MNRKTLLVIALASVFAVPLSNAYAEGDDKEAPKPELIGQSDEKQEAPKPELISQSDEKQEAPKPELISQSDETKKPEQSDETKKPELSA